MLIGKRFAFVCGGDKSPVLSGRVCLQQVTAHLRFMHIDFFSCNSFSFLRHVASCRRWSVGVGCSIRRGLSLTRISHVLSVFEMIIKSRTVSLSIHPSLCMLTVTSHSALPVQGDAFKKHKHTHTQEPEVTQMTAQFCVSQLDCVLAQTWEGGGVWCASAICVCVVRRWCWKVVQRWRRKQKGERKTKCGNVYTKASQVKIQRLVSQSCSQQTPSLSQLPKLGFRPPLH